MPIHVIVDGISTEATLVEPEYIANIAAPKTVKPLTRTILDTNGER